MFVVEYSFSILDIILIFVKSSDCDMEAGLIVPSIAKKEFVEGIRSFFFHLQSAIAIFKKFNY